MEYGPKNIVAVGITYYSAVNVNGKFYADVNIKFIKRDNGGDCKELMIYMEKYNT